MDNIIFSEPPPRDGGERSVAVPEKPNPDMLIAANRTVGISIEDAYDVWRTMVQECIERGEAGS